MVIQDKKMYFFTDAVQKAVSIGMETGIQSQNNFLIWCRNCTHHFDMITAAIVFKKISKGRQEYFYGTSWRLIMSTRWKAHFVGVREGGIIVKVITRWLEKSCVKEYVYFFGRTLRKRFRSRKVGKKWKLPLSQRSTNSSKTKWVTSFKIQVLLISNMKATPIVNPKLVKFPKKRGLKRRKLWPEK